MYYYVKALDNAGIVTLKRESVPAAVKKACELLAEGWRVEIETPSGVVYEPTEFAQLLERDQPFVPPV